MRRLVGIDLAVLLKPVHWLADITKVDLEPFRNIRAELNMLNANAALKCASLRNSAQTGGIHEDATMQRMFWRDLKRWILIKQTFPTAP